MASAPARPRAARADVEPLTADLRRLHLTVSRRLLEKLATARDALSHSHPGASDDEVLEVGLDLIVARHRRRRGIGAKPRARASDAAAEPVHGADPGSAAEPVAHATAPGSVAEPTDAPPPPRSARSRHVPAAVWRAVWERDLGCCAWPLENGGVCGSTYQLELDHVEGWALGAATTIDETRLLCRPHQDVSARRLYGNDLMNAYTRPKGGTCSEPAAAYASPGESAHPGGRPAAPGGGVPRGDHAFRAPARLLSRAAWPVPSTPRAA